LPDGGLEKRILGGANRPIIKARRGDGIRQLHRQAEAAIQLLDFFQEDFRPCRAAMQGTARRLRELEEFLGRGGQVVFHDRRQHQGIAHSMRYVVERADLIRHRVHQA
jgi:hypothetical protein